jgi:hypothetical protein
MKRWKTRAFSPETVKSGLYILDLVEAKTVAGDQFQRSWISPDAPLYLEASQAGKSRQPTGLAVTF